MAGPPSSDAIDVLPPEVALVIIRGHFCEHFTTGLGSCFDNGRHPLALYGADQACHPCIAWAALAHKSREEQ